MIPLDAHPALAAMVRAVRAAGRICRMVQADLRSAGTLRKDDRSPVTVADFASQAVVSRILAGAFPSDALVAEEDATALRDGSNSAVRGAVLECVRTAWDGAAEADVLAAIDRGTADASGGFFVLDPIDGTKGFLRGAQYAVALGRIEHGRVVAAALGCPNLPDAEGREGCVLVAARGAGAGILGLDGEEAAARPVRVSPEADPARTRFCQSVEKAHSNRGLAGEVAATLGVTAKPVAIDSQCKYALVARGDAELYLRLPTRADYVEKIWDHAAGMLVVTEAGGRVTDVDGRPLDFSRGRLLERNRGVVASNGLVHDAVIEAIRRVS